MRFSFHQVKSRSLFLQLLVAVVAGVLVWGVGLGLLTPAVVSAAIASVPGDRAGLASGINNTARQTGGAIGIAAYGALAGPPAATAGFMRGLHVAGTATVVLWLLAAVATACFVPNGR